MMKVFGQLRQLTARLQGRAAATAKPKPKKPTYSTAGSEPISVPTGMVGRGAEGALLAKALETHRVVLLHGAARIGKTWLSRRCAEVSRKRRKPFWYTCPSERRSGELFERLGSFFSANRQEDLGRELIQPEANDDDRANTAAAALEQDEFLVVLDQFDTVAHRDPFRTLVQAVAASDGRGRLLVVARRPPGWWPTLPSTRAAAVEVPPLSAADVRELASGLGFSRQDLDALEAYGDVHPFALQLVLQLSRLQGAPPARILEGIPRDRLEFALLSVLYGGLAERHVIDRLSVLRVPFAPAAATAFGGPANLFVREDVALLLETTKEGRYQLHPTVGEFASDQLGGGLDLLTTAHEQSVVYYRSQLDVSGRWHKRACCELAHHLLSLEQPAEALRVLAAEARGIVSFGFGWMLLSMAGQIEQSGLLDADGLDDAEEAGYRYGLAALYVRLPVVSVDDNRLKAIRLCGRCIDVYRERERPVDLAQSLNLLGMALSDLPSGDVRTNVHRALESYQESLLLFQDLGLADGRMTVHNNIGGAWMKLAEVGGEDCLRRAVAHLRQAVKLFDQSTDLFTQSLVNRNLGNALCQLGKVEEGMEHFASALSHFTLDNHPLEYGGTQQDMGDAHRLLMTGRRTFRLRQAMAYYTEAARVHEQEIFPEDFADTQLGLAIGHRQLAIHEGPEPHYALSIKCYENALRVFTAEDFPFYHRVITDILAREERGEAGMTSEEDEQAR